MRIRPVLSTLLVAAALVAGCSEGNVFSLEPGTCFDDASGDATQISDVPIVDCEEEHDNEVFATFDLPDGDFPGQTEVGNLADEGCLDRFEGYIDAAYADSRFVQSSLFPTEGSWDQGDREVICVVFDMNGEKLTGSVEGSGGVAAMGTGDQHDRDDLSWPDQDAAGPSVPPPAVPPPTSTPPPSAPPSAPLPSAPPPSAPPAWDQPSAPPSSSGGGAGRTIALVVVGLLVVVGGAVAAVVALGGDDGVEILAEEADGDGGLFDRDELTEPTEDPVVDDDPVDDDPVDESQESVFALAVGTCFNDGEQLGQSDEVEAVPIVDCADPHDNEVYATFDLPDGPFPGDDDVADRGNEGCLDRFEAFVGIAYEDSRYVLSTLFPTSASWEQGDREIVCFLYDIDFEKLVGSAAGTAE